MEPLEAGSIQLELKYCERCGALLLRSARGARGPWPVYCPACVWRRAVGEGLKMTA
jgi:hypothetical protein